MSDSDLGEANGRTVAGRITWDINVSTIVILLGAIATGMWFLANSRTQAEQAQRDIARLEGTLTAGLTGLRADLATLPDQRARLDELGRRATETDRWRAAWEERDNQLRDMVTQLRSESNQLRETVTQLRADYASIGRASNTNVLPGAPRRSP